MPVHRLLLEGRAYEATVLSAIGSFGAVIFSFLFLIPFYFILSARVNCQAVVDKGEKPFLCFKANATAKAKGCPAWQISFEAYSDNPDEWMDEYHIRSIVEAVFSSIKRCFGPTLKA